MNDTGFSFLGSAEARRSLGKRGGEVKKPLQPVGSEAERQAGSWIKTEVHSEAETEGGGGYR